MTEDLVSSEPLDSDSPGASPAPLLLSTLLVFIGGCLGTGLRILLSDLIPHAGSIPLGILTINVTGSFALGILLESLSLRGPDTGLRRQLRFFAGTGLIGGYTTYSTLATDSALLLDSGLATAAIFYALFSVLAGLGAGLAGIFAGRLLVGGKKHS